MGLKCLGKWICIKVSNLGHMILETGREFTNKFAGISNNFLETSKKRLVHQRQYINSTHPFNRKTKHLLTIMTLK